MKHASRLLLVLFLLAALLPARTVSAQELLPTTDPICLSLALPGGVAVSGSAPSGSAFCITVPPAAAITELKGLVIFAHGYVFDYPAGLPPIIPYNQLALIDPATQTQTSIPAVVNGMGFVFATTSYSQNGLAVKEGVDNVVELVELVKQAVMVQFGLPALPPFPVYIIGASEGGLVTTLAVEKHPEVFSGGVATCGPVGDFVKQVNYWGDFRVLFDNYFPANLLGDDPVTITDDVMANWGSLGAPGPIMVDTLNLLQADLASGGVNFQRLITAGRAAVDPKAPESAIATTLGLLDYNVMATNQAKVELGGNPYGNIGRLYVAHPFDLGLNRRVQRIAADPAALAEINAYYQTSGSLQRPLVLLHTTLDPIVPAWHMALYSAKAYKQHSLRQLVAIPIARYGHCAFTPAEAVFAFEVMLLKSARQNLSAAQVQGALPDAGWRDSLKQLRVKFADQTK